MKLRYFWIVLTMVAALGVCAWRPVREMIAVHTLENNIVGGDVHSWSAYAPSEGPLARHSKVSELVRRILGDRKWDDWYEGFLRFFTDGPITGVSITGGTVRGDVSAAFARLPQVKSLMIDAEWSPSGGSAMTASDILELCRAARAIPQLEILHITGDNVTDATLSVLRDHPGVTMLEVHSDRITTKCTDTLRTLPALQGVTILGTSTATIFTGEERGAMRVALPRVVVHLAE